jgi:hypothetical protein
MRDTGKYLGELLDQLEPGAAVLWLNRQMERLHNPQWWQIIEPDEWQYQRPVYWELYGSGTVVVYE